jgi:hypothetical protein
MGTRCWVTEIEVGDQTFLFYTPADAAARHVRKIEKLVAAEMRSRRGAKDIIGNLVAIGEDLTNVLLGHDTPESAAVERGLACDALADAAGSVIYRLGAPVPIELLTFDRPIGGIRGFGRMLGGRPVASSQNGRRPGRVLGSGAVLFHDDLIPSCGSGEIEEIMDIAFPNGVEAHRELLLGDRGAAQAEIDRLFKGTQASWIHFQCHATDEDIRALRLTTDFEVTQSAFTEPGGRVAAIMLNACSGTRVGDWWQSSEIPEGSWAEYFTANCGVPAVMGPFCPVLDDRTMPFTKQFYKQLSVEERVFEAFSVARADRLNDDDFTAFAYRYVGPPEIIVPEQARLVSRASEIRKAA